MRPPANHRERCISREVMKLELRQARQQGHAPQSRGGEQREIRAKQQGPRPG